MSKLITFIYVATAVFWVGLTMRTGHTESPAGLYLQILLFVIPLLGAIAGLWNSKLWGGFNSAIGKAVGFVSLGVLAWSIGMLLWNYYIFIAKVEIPYPSLADAAFILSWPLWTIGVVFLSKATGVKFALRQLKGKIMLVLVPIIAAVASYYLLVTIARDGTMDFEGSSGWKIFFDLFYPIGSATIFTLSVTFFSLSRDYLGGIYKTPIILLTIAFIVNFFSDFTFSYTTTKGTYFNGHFVDFMFATGMFLFALSLSMMSPPRSLLKPSGTTSQ